MTKYRLISNGYWDYLQYEEEYSYLFFWKRKRWSYVWKPYYDKVTGRYYVDCPDDKGYVNSLNGIRPESFVKQWPNIEEYFVWANIEQFKLVEISTEYFKTRDALRNNIRYLN